MGYAWHSEEELARCSALLAMIFNFEHSTS